jgi:hypothetical protein
VNPSQEPPAYTFAADPEPAPEQAPEQAPEPGPGRSWRRTAVVAVLAGLVVAVAGAPLGVLWHFVAPPVPVVDAGTGGFVVNDPSPEEYIAADGWFTLIGFAFGLVAAVVAWLVLRRRRGPGLLLGVTLGALAAGPLAWFTGRLIGLSAYQHWRDVAAAGDTYQAPPDLHAKGALLVPAFAAVIVLTLLAGWSNDPDLERPGAKPGYGHDIPPARAAEPESETGPESDFSSDLPGGPDRTAAPAPPAPGQAGPPRG